MNLGWGENLVRWAGGLLAFVALAIILYGVWRGMQRPAGRTVGRTGPWLRSAAFYFASAAFFFGVAYWGWRPLPVSIPSAARSWMLALGALLYFPAMMLILWARMALGENYFVSTGLGAQLFTGHRLVTDGPFAFVRHPMYTGIILAALGSLLMYTTWTALFFVCFSPFTALRARREETVLAEEFGEAWRAYARRVPAFVPRVERRD